MNETTLTQTHNETEDTTYDQGRSLWQDALARLLKNKMAILGLVYLVLQFAAAIFAPWIAPFSYESTDLLQEPSHLIQPIGLALMTWGETFLHVFFMAPECHLQWVLLQQLLVY